VLLQEVWKRQLVQLRPLALGGLLVALAAPAVAAPRRATPVRGPSAHDARQEKIARGHFDKAEKAFNLGRFDEALAGYQAAYEALPLPAFVFNIAQCHRNLGNDEQAVFFYQRFLSLQPDAPNRPVVEELIAEQTRHLDERKAAEAAQLAAETPLIPRTEEEPAPGEKRTDLGARPIPDSPAIAQRTAERPAPPPPRKRSSQKWWLFGVLGAAVLGGVALLVLRNGGKMPTGQLGSIDTR
jgi:tetratricopeptide (TPR) repeat protein